MKRLLLVVLFAVRIILTVLLGMAAGYEVLALVAARSTLGWGINFGLAAAITVVAALWVAFVRARGGRRWMVDTAVVLPLIALTAWLAWDPPAAELAQPLGPPVPAAAEPSRAIMERVMRGGACDAWPDPVAAIPSARSMLPDGGIDDDPYCTWLRENAPALERAWEIAAPSRAWLVEVNTCDTVSDFCRGFDSPVCSFTALRALDVVHRHRAAMLALEGRGDEALATLVPVANVAGKLRRGSRTLVTLMIGDVLEHDVLRTARFVARRVETTREARLALAAVLDDGVDEVGDLARCLRIEADLGSDALDRARQQLRHDGLAGAFGAESLAWTRWVGGSLVAGLLFDPNASKMQYRGWMNECARSVEQNDPAFARQMDDYFEHERLRPPARNPIGAIILSAMVPAIDKVEQRCRARLMERRDVIAALRGQS